MEPMALWYLGNGQAACRPAQLGDGTLQLRTLASGLSRGTERLVFSGQVPASELARMALPNQEGSFAFPIKYGYSCVARVEAGPTDLIGQTVFTMHPHQTHFHAHISAVHLVPPSIPPNRATLAANMETALNAIWDAQLRPGAPVAVIGAGVVGCLTAYLAQHVAKANVTLVDIIDERSEIASELRVSFAHAKRELTGMSHVFHTSASAGGLAAAIEMLDFEGTVIEMSWYGDKPIAVPLGGAFHANRLHIQCSQVGAVAAPRRANTTYADRIRTAIGLLDDPALDALLTHHIAFTDAPQALPDRLAPDASGIATVITY